MGAEIVIVSHIPEVTAEILRTAKERMEEAVMVVRNQTLETLSGKRSGRVYRLPYGRGTYTASAPGEPPATRFGELKKSIQTTVEGEEKQIIGAVGTDKKTGPMLEFGTRKMAARPWLRISFEKMIDKVKEIFSKEWLKQ